MSEQVSLFGFVAVTLLLLVIIHIQSRRIDRIHRRISLTTELNGLRDPWRDAESRPTLSKGVRE